MLNNILKSILDSEYENYSTYNFRDHILFKNQRDAVRDQGVVISTQEMECQASNHINYKEFHKSAQINEP